MDALHSPELTSTNAAFTEELPISNPKKYFSKDFNAAGALTHSRESFSPIETGTIRLRSNEIWNRRDFSGDKTTALWGLITYTDY